MEVSMQEILGQLVSAVSNYKMVTMQVSISSIIFLIIGTTRNSFFSSLLWNKMGAFKVLLAPILGILTTIIGLGSFSLPILIQGLGSGAGAIALHELFDALRTLPFIGEKTQAVISFLATILKKPDQKYKVTRNGF